MYDIISACATKCSACVNATSCTTCKSTNMFWDEETFSCKCEYDLVIHHSIIHKSNDIKSIISHKY